MNNSENKKKPFFSEFLENQLSDEQSHRVQGGDGTSVIEDQAQTQKYPSDQEDNPQTQKYPSDQEGNPTKPLLDEAQTQKYPSDGDDDLPPMDI